LCKPPRSLGMYSISTICRHCAVSVFLWRDDNIGEMNDMYPFSKENTCSIFCVSV